VTIEDLERGMKLLFDQQVHSSQRLDRIEALQQKAGSKMLGKNFAVLKINDLAFS
jgi:hypothetical protein